MHVFIYFYVVKYAVLSQNKQALKSSFLFYYYVYKMIWNIQFCLTTYFLFIMCTFDLLRVQMWLHISSIPEQQDIFSPNQSGSGDNKKFSINMVREEKPWTPSVEGRSLFHHHHYLSDFAKTTHLYLIVLPSV